MRTYKDIDSFSEWKDEEKNQFSLAVTKGLIIDMVRKANSGHSGGPMSSADFTQILFNEYLNYDPNNPDIMYVGTGERMGIFSTSSRGLGMWKTTDGGQTWSHLTSTENFNYVTDIKRHL